MIAAQLAGMRPASVIRMMPRLPWVLACLALFACSDDGADAADSGQNEGSSGSTTQGAIGSAGDTDSGSGSGGASTETDTSVGGSTQGSTSVGSTSGTETTEGDSSGDASTSDATSTGGNDGTALHVAEFGQNSNPGTPDEPMRTIQWALGQAEMNPQIDTIRVAGGTYEADVANDASIVMLEGVSMLGGWDDDFDGRDPEAWPSHLVDSSAVAPAGTAENSPSPVVEVPVGVTQDTVFDGFRVEIGRGQHRTGLLVQGDATISGNTFDRHTDPNAVVATAVFVNGGAPRISGNVIDLDYVGATSQLRGINVLSGAPVIANNVITLTGATFAHYGIGLNNASPDILGNSIEVHDGTNIYLIRLLSGSQPRIDNNVLQADSGSNICVASLSATAVPTSLRNNLLQCYYATWGNGTSSVGSWQTIAQVHAGVTNASGNVKLAGALVDSEDGLILDASDPCSVTRGGLDLTDELPEDIAELPRTAPTSMGAHEWDGDCD